MLTLNQITTIFENHDPEQKNLTQDKLQEVFKEKLVLQANFQKACVDIRRYRNPPSKVVKEFLNLFCTELIYDCLYPWYSEKKKLVRFFNDGTWMPTFTFFGEKCFFRLYGYGPHNKGRLRMWQFHNSHFYHSLKEISPPEKEFKSRDLIHGEYIRRIDRDLFVFEWVKLNEFCDELYANSVDFNLPLLMCRGVIEPTTELIWQNKFQEEKRDWISDSKTMNILKEQTDYVKINQQWDKKLERFLEKLAPHVKDFLLELLFYIIIIAYVVIFVKSTIKFGRGMRRYRTLF